ncbi:MAG TPA: DNA polymerase I [Acidimicrobiales bacterium]|nr:DNA polymerase I [Acidimicrobiales bacterium]
MTPEPGKGPVILLDGMSLAFRAWFAVPETLVTKDGTVTNAVHGFSLMVVNLVRDHRPSSLAVAFDLPGVTFRDELVSDYKAGRAETPDALYHQFDLIRDVLAALCVPVVGVPGFEADDVLATLATEARDEGRNVIVVTGDRDCFQLVEDPHVKVLYNKRGVRDYDLYDEAGIVARTGVPPASYPLLAALRGDTSDNLPGVPGVGEKTAAKLLTSYGDLDGIYSHLPELTPKLRENLAAYEDRVRANLSVIPLIRDVALDVALDDLTLGGWDTDSARETFIELELHTVWRLLVPLLRDGTLGPPADGSGLPDEVEGMLHRPEQAAEPEAPTEGRGVTLASLVDELPVLDVNVAQPADARAAAAALKTLAARPRGGVVALAGRSAGLAGRSPLRGLALVAGDPPTEAVWLDASLLIQKSVATAVTKVLGRDVAGHHVKELFRSLLPLGIDGRGLVMDTAVAGYLLDPAAGDYPIVAAVDGAPAVGQLALGEPEVDDTAAAIAEAAAVTRLVGPLRQALSAEGLVRLHDEVETPLVRVLARMEVLGVRVDVVELQRLAEQLASDTQALEERIHVLAGHEFNVNSTPQLRTVLFDELGLTPGRKTKTGYSTDAQTLESLRDEHEIVDTLLRYRELEKLRSTYGESLLAEVADDGRIHASFGQTVARTGRLSSERPNLHNIPKRGEAGRQFRRAFVPAEGCSFLVADYDQIELRVLAHLSGDPGLVEAFTSGADVHRTVAAGVFSVPPEEVTPAQRERAKMVSYGLAYGMQGFGLARRLSTGVEEATEIRDRYFKAFPEVAAYMDDIVVEARARGYTRTALGRKRPLPELSDRNYQVRQTAERQAMNAGIQGLAADLFKTALVRLDAALEDGHLESRLVLQVHDEVIVEVVGGEEEVVGPLTEAALTGAADLSVPLVVSMAFGASWADAKS